MTSFESESLNVEVFDALQCMLEVVLYALSEVYLDLYERVA